jgi:hypothetical protein
VLWVTGATAEATAHPDVLRVIETDDGSSDRVADLLKAFATAAEQGDHLLIQAMLAEHIPTFAPFLKGEPV